MQESTYSSPSLQASCWENSRRKFIWKSTKSQDFFCYCCILLSFPPFLFLLESLDITSAILEDWSFLFSSVLGFGAQSKMHNTFGSGESVQARTTNLCRLQFVFISFFFCVIVNTFALLSCWFGRNFTVSPRDLGIRVSIVWISSLKIIVMFYAAAVSENEGGKNDFKKVLLSLNAPEPSDIS